MHVLLDINVILDSMLRRPPWSVDADAILTAAAEGELTCAVTSLSLATIFYVGRKHIGTQAARDKVRTYLQAFDILPVNKQTVIEADTLPGSDFEDNIQIAAALFASLDAIISRNVADYTHSPVPVWEPSELLRRLRSSGQSQIP